MSFSLTFGYFRCLLLMREEEFECETSCAEFEDENLLVMHSTYLCAQ
jgi:hypothetical protein